MMLGIKTCSNYTLYFFLFCLICFHHLHLYIITDQSCLSINGKCYTEDRYCNCLEAITKPTETYIMKPIDEGTKPKDADTTRLVLLQYILVTSVIIC